jgi:hypothetical protein
MHALLSDCACNGGGGLWPVLLASPSHLRLAASDGYAASTCDRPTSGGSSGGLRTPSVPVPPDVLHIAQRLIRDPGNYCDQADDGAQGVHASYAASTCSSPTNGDSSASSKKATGSRSCSLRSAPSSPWRAGWRVT